mgnify:FL=1
MTNSVYSSDAELRCSCGAKCADGSKRTRFLERHPRLCSERQDFTRQLAQGTRSVESDGEPYATDGSHARETILHYVEAVNATGRGLTTWEEDFMESITEQFEERAWLTDKQREILGRIYEDRT